MKQLPTYKFRTTIFNILLFLFFNGLALLLYTNVSILQYETGIVAIEHAPTTTYALIFGGGMQEDGSQSIMQMDRVATGVSLYDAKKVSTLVMTGDDGGNNFDEVHAMEDQAIQYGVVASDVSLDPHGYRTYESCYRAKHVYGIDQAIVVSQSFHLPRIMYICSSMGIEVVGVAADNREYEDDFFVTTPREILARLKAWWQVEITKPLPRVLH